MKIYFIGREQSLKNIATEFLEYQFWMNECWGIFFLFFFFYYISVFSDAMWKMNLISSETMDSGQYPERPGEPDCSYYIRTGLCRFGETCRFNHPPNRKLV